MRLRTILSVWPPRPARPLNGTTAIAAPRRSSSCQTGSPEISSCRPGRSRAVCACEASRPDGVRHGSPLSALHLGHGRARHPRATCSFVGDLVLLRYDVRQREPGATRHVGHHSSSHSARSLTACPVAEAPPRHCSSAQSASRGLGRPAAAATRRGRRETARNPGTTNSQAAPAPRSAGAERRLSRRRGILTLGLTRTLRGEDQRCPGRAENFRVQDFLGARPERFELPTFGSVDRRSIQLSYGRSCDQRTPTIVASHH